MATFHELHQILQNLVEAWPEDRANPTVERARQFLEAHPESASNGRLTHEPTYHVLDGDEHLDAAWYSI